LNPSAEIALQRKKLFDLSLPHLTTTKRLPNQRLMKDQ
jgi:hypothetical protein